MGADLASSYAYVEAFGMAEGAYSRVLAPRSVEGIRAALRHARSDKVPLGLRGAGQSYGDASVNARGHVLDITRMDRILDFDSTSGIVEAEAGLSIGGLWRHALPRGFWPRVVPGTMAPTLAGVAAMNIHGKNAFAVGTIGDAIQEFDLVLPCGELVTCSRTREAELFHAAIGGIGALGVMSRLVLECKRVHSGDLEVRTFAHRDLGEAMAYVEARKHAADYLVSWLDAFASGDELGRGVLHEARYLSGDEDDHPERTLAVAHQELPGRLLGVFPKSEVWRILRLLNHDPGMRLLNRAKFQAGRIEAMGEPRRQPHAAFAFLLDYVPHWKWAYGRHGRRGLIQFQPFVPTGRAHEVLTEILLRSQRAGLVPYLAVLKRHRPDPFLMTHGLDGWSLALDFKVTPERRAELWKHCNGLAECVVDGGGRFYFAKDLVISAEIVGRMYAPERLAAFLALKERLDPEGLLETNQWRRCFGPLRAQS